MLINGSKTQTQKENNCLKKTDFHFDMEMYKGALFTIWMNKLFNYLSFLW
jgi:hypothetical protein